MIINRVCSENRLLPSLEAPTKRTRKQAIADVRSCHSTLSDLQRIKQTLLRPNVIALQQFGTRIPISLRFDPSLGEECSTL